MSHCHLNYTYAEQETYLEREGVGDRVLGTQLCLHVRLKGLVSGGDALTAALQLLGVNVCGSHSVFLVYTLPCIAVDHTCSPCGAWCAGNRDTDRCGCHTPCPEGEVGGDSQLGHLQSPGELTGALF